MGSNSKPNKKYVAYVDGGCPGNGKNAKEMFGSYAVYDITAFNWEDEGVDHEALLSKKPLLCSLRASFMNTCGQVTNNVAELMAFQMALNAVLRSNILAEGTITFLMDSALTINQLKGIYNIKKLHLRKIHAQINQVMQKDVNRGLKEKINLEWISGETMKQTILEH